VQGKIEYVGKLHNRDYLIREMTENTRQFVAFVKELDCVLNRKIEPMPDQDSWQPYTEVHCWKDRAKVDLFEVEGTGHPDYQGLTWIDMLLKGKRMPHNLMMLRTNPDYYFTGQVLEPGITYVRINDKLYVHYDGNHRTAIAKVLFYFLGKTDFGLVTYHKYFVRLDLKEKVEQIRKLLESISVALHFSVQRKITARLDAPGWMKEIAEFSFTVENKRTAKKLVLKEEELVPFFYEAVRFKQSRWRRFLPRNHYTEVL